MTEVKAIVLRAAGINCDMETEYALELAGAQTQRTHINRIIEDKTLLDEFQKARAHILFKKKHIDFKSPLKKIEQTAAKRKLDFRAYYLHPILP